MCLFTSTPTIDRHRGVLDPPPHRSRYSAHGPPGTVRLPRGSTTSYHREREYRTSGGFRRSGDLIVGERDSVEYVDRVRRPREIEYYEGRRSGGFVEERERRSVDVGRVVEGRRSALGENETAMEVVKERILVDWSVGVDISQGLVFNWGQGIGMLGLSRPWS
ncbi:hypothetical protein P154DRAFT_528359 [Amniculicola lignicola CBS 123094]|uniref:Uncharacterized protein n=1 Tax=Amniculicola lignicola CBS 123094 TaxID=1392246 RepID=A0A6A5X404_9PLEO|nr:hypothetical protein P154DRAFT_528359 [Amniculicola lignicola CBS 123094]